MSASREKKLRQDAGPSVRDSQAQKEAAAYKKKAVTYTAIGVVIAVLVAALLIWNSGFFQGMESAASVGDTKYSIGDVSYFYEQAKYQSNYFYYAYGMSQYIPDDGDVQDSTTGATWRDYYLDQALESMTQLTALYDAAVKDGYKNSDVTDSVNEQIAEVKEVASSNGYSYGSYLKLRYGKFMSTGDYKDIITKQAVANQYYTDHYNSLTYSDEEIDAYYQENKDTLDTYEYSYLYFTPEAVGTTDSEGNELSEEQQSELTSLALAEAKVQADEALSALRSGKSIADAVTECSPSDSADHTTAVGSSVSSLYSEKLFAMNAGDFELVENGESGYYVVTLHDRTRVEDPTRDTRHVLINAETTTDSDGNTVAPTDEAWAAAKEQADKVLAEYNAGDKTAEAFGALAEKYSGDTGSNTNGGLYEGVTQGNFVTEYDTWLYDTARQPGDVDLLKHPEDGSSSNYYGYHIVYYVGENDPVWKLTSVEALKSTAVNEWLEDLQSSYTGTLESGSKNVG